MQQGTKSVYFILIRYSKYTIRFTVYNILFNLWFAEEPYPYTKRFCKHGYSLAVIHSSITKGFNEEVTITQFDET